MSVPSSPVRQMELSTDGSRLFLLYPGRLVVRDVDSGEERTLAGDLAGDEEDFDVSSDGRRVSLRRGEHLKIWDASTGSLVRDWTSDGSISDAAPRMMPDGRCILDPREGGVYLIDIDTAEPRMHLRARWRPWQVEVSGDGRWIEATSDRAGDAWLESDVEQVARWDTTTGKRIPLSKWEDDLTEFYVSGHGYASISALTPDHRCLVGAFRDGLVAIQEKNEVRWLTGHSAGVTAVAVSPDGQTIVSASLDGTVHVCRPHTGAGPAAISRASAPVVKCAIRPDGKTVVAVEETGRVHVLRDWLSAPPQPLPHDLALAPIEWALAPDGSRLLLLCPGRLVARDVDSGAERMIVDGLWGNEGALVSSVDGRRVSLRCGVELRIWDVDSGSLVRAWRAVDERARMMPDGCGILDRPRGAQCGLALFDVDTCNLKVNLSPAQLAGPIQVSADSRWVAAGTFVNRDDTRLAVWNAVTGRAVNLAAGSPGSGQFRGHWFAAVDMGASVWDLSTGARVFYRQDYKRPFTALAALPDDRGMVVGFGDGRLGIWDLTSESKVRRLPGHAAGIRAIAVTPNGRAIVSASADGVVQVCAVRGGAVTATFSTGAPLRDCVIRPDGRTVVAVEETRRVHVLRDLLSPSVRR